MQDKVNVGPQSRAVHLESQHYRSNPQMERIKPPKSLTHLQETSESEEEVELVLDLPQQKVSARNKRKPLESMDYEDLEGPTRRYNS